MRRALPIALLVLAVCASPALAGTAKLRAVSVPRSATAGMTVDVTVKLAGKRHARAPKLAFYLAADAKHDSQDLQLAKSGGRPRIPESQSPGSYRLLACAAKSCRASRAFQVTKTPVGTPQLVDQAVAAGRLSPEQGLVYRAFAAFGDSRLPAAYAGDDSAHEDTIMREIAESWPKLSSAQRRQVEPFFTPPAARGAARAAASAAGAPGVKPTCSSNKLAGKGWTSIAHKDGHVRIWWRTKDSGRFAKQAHVLLNEADDTIWRKIWEPFGREPLSDAGEHCFHGGDGKLDVYILNRTDADTKAETVNYPDGCSQVPTYIVFYAGATQPTRWELAHEITHSIQSAFQASSCASWAHFDEAVATWGGQYAYPHDDREHEFTWFSKEPSTPLADATYDGWVFPYAMEQVYGPGVMQRIYEQGASHEAMHAIDAGAPGGLAKAYPEFARLAWNHDPVKPSFWEWDGFDPVPEDAGGEIVPEQVDLGAEGQNEAQLTLPEKPLSRAYKDLRFTPNTRYVAVMVPYDADLHVDALVTLRDGTTKTIDLTKRRGPVFCPEAAGDRIAEMVLVASNDSTFHRMAQDKPIRVAANNLGCSRYAGSGEGVEHTHYSARNTTESWTVTNLVYQRDNLGEDNPGLGFKLAGGTVKWSYSGSFDGCAVSASATFQLPPSDHSGGYLGIDPAPGAHARNYSLTSPSVPSQPVTAVCPDGTRTWNITPHRALETWNWPTREFTARGDGTIDDTNSGDEATGGARDVSFHWHLEPQP
jgi:Family of unknown function (DUF6055)